MSDKLDFASAPTVAAGVHHTGAPSRGAAFPVTSCLAPSPLPKLKGPTHLGDRQQSTLYAVNKQFIAPPKLVLYSAG